MAMGVSTGVVDVLIVGGGPAGLSAALSLSRQMYSTILFDSKVYRNAAASHMHNVPGFDHVEPSSFRAAIRKDIFDGRYTSNRLVNAKVESISKLVNGHFSASTLDGQTYEGRKLVLATGVRDLYPSIPGYEENWGKTVFHCLFCHGFEERGTEHAGVLVADSPMLASPQVAVTIGCMAKRFAREVTLYTHGDDAMAARIREEGKPDAYALKVDSRPIASMKKLAGDAAKGHADGVRLHFTDGSAAMLSFIAHAPRYEMSGNWGEQLGLEMEKGNYKVDFWGETSVPGCFAAGDNAALAKAVGTAVSAGGFVGAGIAHQLVLGH